MPDASNIKRNFYNVKRGHQGQVLLDSEPIACATSCKTGENGWVKFNEVDAEGNVMLAGSGIVTGWSRGRVEFVPNV